MSDNLQFDKTSIIDSLSKHDVPFPVQIYNIVKYVVDYFLYSNPKDIFHAKSLLEDYIRKVKENPENYVKERKVEKDLLNPSHYYTGGVQPLDIISFYNLDFFSGNVVKYIFRWPHKGGIVDLEKALFYLNSLADKKVLDKQ